LERVDVEKITGEDYLMQEPLAKGQIDAAYCWFNHAIYGARHGFPVQAVMLFNDAPGMKVLVADRMKGRIASAADFTGGKVGAGALDVPGGHREAPGGSAEPGERARAGDALRQFALGGGDRCQASCGLFCREGSASRGGADPRVAADVRSWRLFDLTRGGAAR